MKIPENKEVIIPVDLDVVKKIVTESPDGQLKWSHNGIYVINEQETKEKNVTELAKKDYNICRLYFFRKIYFHQNCIVGD